MKITTFWSFTGGTDPNWIRRFMSYLSLYIREKQYKFFLEKLKPTKTNTILDIGTSPDERLQDTNFFEKRYSYKNQLTIASVENCSNLVTKYKLRQYIKIKPGEKLNIKSKSFDLVVSWATLEHVGTFEDQKLFLKEVSRIGKKIFVTTPDKASFYEPHTGTFFLHWLPSKMFRKIMKLLDKNFWSKEDNLNIISFSDAKKMVAHPDIKAERFKLFGLLPSHIFIYGETE